jgi:protein tyrosine kinase modulator
MLEQTESQIGEINGRINNVPTAEVTLNSLDRDYQTQKLAYDNLLEKRQQAELSAKRATGQQGETIQVVDPANLPEKPVAPKRLLLTGAGLGLGLVLGLLLMAVVEIPRLLTIQTSEDAEHYSGLPVLASLPELMTPEETKMVPVRQRMWLIASFVATLVSIPALAFALRLSRVFERFLS